MVGADRRGAAVRAIPHAARDVVAVDCKSVDVLDHAHAAPHVAHERKSLAKVRRREERRRVAKRLRKTPARRGVEQRKGRRTGSDVLPRDEPQERPVARKHHALSCDESRRLEQRLRCTGHHHAGQRPSGNRKRTLERAGRDHDGARMHEPRFARDAKRDVEPAIARRAMDHTVVPGE